MKAAGRRVESQRVLQETVARTGRFVEAGNESSTPPFEAAAALALLGRRAEALDWLGKAIDAGWRDVRWARRDPLLAGLSTDAAFQRLLDEAGRRMNSEREAIRKGDEETGNRRF